MTLHPRPPGRRWQPGEPLRDTEQRWPVEASRRRYDGSFVQVREDDVRGPDGESFGRVVVEHQGAVGVVVLDTEGWVLLLRQYRHPAGMRLLELPAGILDVEDESPAVAAARELAEEAGVRAAQWAPLLQMWSSPGMSDEFWHVFVARDLSAVPADEITARMHEEADLEVLWVPLAEAVRAVLDRRITSPMAVAGLLAAWVDGATLRP